MKTFEFTVLMEVSGFEEVQEAGEWLEKSLESNLDPRVIDFGIDSNVRVIDYVSQ